MLSVLVQYVSDTVMARTGVSWANCLNHESLMQNVNLAIMPFNYVQYFQFKSIHIYMLKWDVVIVELAACTPKS